MGLSQYYKKRDFKKTPEPKGERTHKASGLFVIQKHAARRLHYDFRIELQGVLKSWAIPKGPSLDPHVKRLAVHVEDHPIGYGSFEGIIPKGQYGGGTVMLWDKGWWEPLDPPVQAYKKGHLRFNIHAEKMHGRWDLIRLKDEKSWLLIKHQDEYAQNEAVYDLTEDKTLSVVSQRSMEDIASGRPALTTSLLPAGLKKTTIPDFIAPQLATLVDTPPVGKQWLHEIKFDGYRILAFKKGAKVLLKSRNNKDWTANFPLIAQAICSFSCKQVIFDGEVVVLDAQGRSNFQLLQNALPQSNRRGSKADPRATHSLMYFVFDVLYVDGHDLRSLPLLERKKILKNIWQQNKPIPHLHHSDYLAGQGKKMYEYLCQQGLEGMVSKRADSLYAAQRNKNWLKVKCGHQQEFIIGGYTPPKSTRSHFGALLLGVYNQQGTLDFAGKVGTGFSEENLKEIHQMLIKNTQKSNPFNITPPGAKKVHWVKPKLVCEVKFANWTDSGSLRHASFQGMRKDKPAFQVVREYAPLTVKITHPEKIIYPEDGIKKKDLLAYYESVSTWIMPYVALRPLTLVRCPSDYKKCFYQRHYTKAMPQGLYPLHESKDKANAPYLYVKDEEGLLNLVQMGVLEIHPWGSTLQNLERPDVMIFDLDPGEDVAWAQVVAGAKDLRDHLQGYDLKSFVKTTGGKGLHVVVPIVPEHSWDEVKEFTHVFVQLLEQLYPQKYLSQMTKSKRGGKIFIDYLRNQRGATAVSAYSTRARLHAPVSTPLAWEELSQHIQHNTYTIKTLPERLEQLKKDPWEGFWTLKQRLRLTD